ncbi:thioredoxin [Persicimonas caeni]|jgi:thioredoxin 1|uniref:Thioredoxin n=1 Tax=Persicimonas caeni TaxID=2292766 RepID=A0A4Y6Q028_PERCE|nr:thioredoxin [Persicimonas caeni]QDG53789.1 thioredoxin [Persicimonas caeni]QED35010.1 thioredoxin [Persicimonas caeni]
MSNDAIELTTDNFEAEVLESDLPVVVDFWAEWCGPCKALSPLVDELAAEYDGQVKVGKVDIDSNTHLANEHRIQAVPTLIFFHKGHVLRRLTGNVSRSQLEEMFEQLVEVAEEDEA